MLSKTERALRRAGWAGKLLAVRLPAKDLSDLHVDNPVGFGAAFNACLIHAEPVPDVLARFDANTAKEDVKMMELLRSVLPNRKLNPADKVIVMVGYGFDILIASTNVSRTFSHTPAEWRREILRRATRIARTS